MAKTRLTRQQSKAKTRRDVLRAATRLFLRDGFVATSLSAIADEAGVTKGAVYSNFESKEDLFLTILRGDPDDPRETPEELAPAGYGAFQQDGDLADRCAQHGRDVAALGPSSQLIALFLEYNAFALRSPRPREFVAEHNRRHIEAAGARIVDDFGEAAEDAASIMQSLYVGLLMHRAFEPERYDDELFARAFGLLAGLAED